MKKKTQSIGYVILASAIIWGIIIYGCASALKGTECYSEIQNILIAGAFAHLIFVWPLFAKLCKRNSKNEDVL